MPLHLSRICRSLRGTIYSERNVRDRKAREFTHVEHHRRDFAAFLQDFVSDLQTYVLNKQRQMNTPEDEFFSHAARQKRSLSFDNESKDCGVSHKGEIPRAKKRRRKRRKKKSKPKSSSRTKSSCDNTGPPHGSIPSRDRIFTCHKAEHETASCCDDEKHNDVETISSFHSKSASERVQNLRNPKLATETEQCDADDQSDSIRHEKQFPSSTRTEACFPQSNPGKNVHGSCVSTTPESHIAASESNNSSTTGEGTNRDSMQPSAELDRHCSEISPKLESFSLHNDTSLYSTLNTRYSKHTPYDSSELQVCLSSPMLDQHCKTKSYIILSPKVHSESRSTILSSTKPDASTDCSMPMQMTSRDHAKSIVHKLPSVNITEDVGQARSSTATPAEKSRRVTSKADKKPWMPTAVHGADSSSATSLSTLSRVAPPKIIVDSLPTPTCYASSDRVVPTADNDSRRNADSLNFIPKKLMSAFISSPKNIDVDSESLPAKNAGGTHTISSAVPQNDNIENEECQPANVSEETANILTSMSGSSEPFETPSRNQDSSNITDRSFPPKGTNTEGVSEPSSSGHKLDGIASQSFSMPKKVEEKSPFSAEDDNGHNMNFSSMSTRVEEQPCSPPEEINEKDCSSSLKSRNADAAFSTDEDDHNCRSSSNSSSNTAEAESPFSAGEAGGEDASGHSPSTPKKAEEEPCPSAEETDGSRSGGVFGEPILVLNDVTKHDVFLPLEQLDVLALLTAMRKFKVLYVMVLLQWINSNHGEGASLLFAFYIMCKLRFARTFSDMIMMHLSANICCKRYYEARRSDH